MELSEFPKLDISEIFKIENFWNFSNWKFLEFPKLKIKTFWNFSNWNFLKFSKFVFFLIFQIKIWNWKLKFLEFFFNFPNKNLKSEIEIFGISKIENFGTVWDFANWKFFEFSKSTIFEIFKIGNFWNFRNWNFLKFSNLEIFWILQI